MKEIVEALMPVMILAIFAVFWIAVLYLGDRACRDSSKMYELPPLPSFSSTPKYTYSTTVKSNSDLTEDQIKAIADILKQKH